MAEFYRCAVGPQLHRIFTRNSRQSRAYEANGLEQCGSGVIRALSLAWSVCYSTSLLTAPAVGFYLLKKYIYTAIFVRNNVLLVLHSVTTFNILTHLERSGQKPDKDLCFVLGALCIRGYGRFKNQDYRIFLALLEETRLNNNEDNKKKLGLYDFTFGAWPVDYKWDESKADRNMRRGSENTTSHSRPSGFLSLLGSWPCDFLRYFVAHSVGRPMIYPGSTGLLQSGFGEALLTGRHSCLNVMAKEPKWRQLMALSLTPCSWDKRMSEDDKSKGKHTGHYIWIFSVRMESSWFCWQQLCAQPRI
ncbi:Protein abhd16a [Desmophyllum pertusum]|uniref:Protein abhd16a n=1 Tax=Desmophyllum pertusum TaxID=174260 RepID=A0A9W9Z9X1_9CNID|nr:Protein abhd16a [Desmophyllum pertusum]